MADVDDRAKRDMPAAELLHERDRAVARGRRNYMTAYGLRLTGLFASVAAGAVGILSHVPAWVVGVMALVPSATALLGQQLKLQPRANFFYRMADHAAALGSRARYSGLDVDNAGALAWEWSQFRTRMTEEWASSLGIDWTLTPPPRPAEHPHPSSRA